MSDARAPEARSHSAKPEREHGPPIKEPKKGPMKDPIPDEPPRRDPPTRGPDHERKRFEDPKAPGQPSEIRTLG